jgi:DNA (cytosine-5)-methyltransferase 1
MLKVLTLCSGIEAVIQGYENLLIPHCHVAACEKDQKVRVVIEHNFDARTIFPDVCTLRCDQVPEHDMMWAGFPCQPFSPSGLNQGLADSQGRGIIILRIIRLIKGCMPRIVVLENVGAMTSAPHREFFEAVLGILGEIRSNGRRYIIEWRLLDARYFGIPQSRPRVWIVCVRSDAQQHAPVWPTAHPDPCCNIDDILGVCPPRQQVKDHHSRLGARATIAS